MKSKERDAVYGSKYITFKRAGKTHKLFTEGIICYMAVVMNGFVMARKGSIFDPDMDVKVCEGSIEGLEEEWINTSYSELSKLHDLLCTSFDACYIDGTNAARWIELNRWQHRYNAVAKEFARVHKTKVKVFGSWQLKRPRHVRNSST